MIASEGEIDEVATADVALKAGDTAAIGDELTIGRWNVVVIVG